MRHTSSLSRREFLEVIFLGSSTIMACKIFQPENEKPQVAATVAQQSTEVVQQSTPDQSTQESPKGPEIIWSLDYIPHDSPGGSPKPRSVYLIDSLGAAVADLPDGGVSLIDLKSGKVKWNSQINSRILGADSELVYIVPNEKRLEALDIKTGVLKWRTLLEIPKESDLMGGLKDDVYCGIEEEIYSINSTIVIPIRYERSSSGNGILSIDKDTGNILWLKWEEIGVYLESNNVVTLNSYEHRFRSRDILSSQENWGVDSIAAGSWRDFFILNNMLVGKNFSQDYYFRFMALDLITGQTLWRSDIYKYANILYTPNPSAKNIYIENQDGLLIAIDPYSGEIIWIGENIATYSGDWRFLGEWAGLVLLTSKNFGMTRAFDASNYSKKWENAELFVDILDYDINVQNTWNINNRVVGTTDNSIVIKNDVGIWEFVFQGIDIKTGERKWELPSENTTMGIVHSNKLFSAEWGDNLLRIIDADTGNIIKSIVLPGGPYSWKPPTIFGNQIIFELYVKDGLEKLVSISL